MVSELKTDMLILNEVESQHVSKINGFVSYTKDCNRTKKRIDVFLKEEINAIKWTSDPKQEFRRFT